MICRRRVALPDLRFGMIEQLVSYLFILENELSVATHHLTKLSDTREALKRGDVLDRCLDNFNAAGNKMFQSQKSPMP